MIPNALAQTGPYAGLWSYLKSIDHALARAVELQTPNSLSELDRERLLALSSFLKGGLARDTAASSLHLGELLESNKPDYKSAIDVRQHLTTLEPLGAWLKSSKVGLEKKIERLINALNTAVNPPKDKLFPKDFPTEELNLLRVIVRSLLADAEAALHI